MKKILFSLFVSAAVGLGVVAQQSLVSGTLAGATNNVVSTNGLALTWLSLTDTSGTNNLMIVYDNDIATSTNIITPAFTNALLSYSTNVVTTWTDPEGVERSRTNSVIYRTTATVAGTTNEARRVYTVIVPASGNVTLPIQSQIGLTYGLVIKAANAGLYSAEIKKLP